MTPASAFLRSLRMIATSKARRWPSFSGANSSKRWCRKSYVAVDFPRATVHVSSRAEEDALGRSRGFLVEYSPDEVINWSYDDDGQLEWIVIRTSWLRQSEEVKGTWRQETRWLYYDREKYNIYRAADAATQPQNIEMVDSGRHGLASQRARQKKSWVDSGSGSLPSE